MAMDAAMGVIRNAFEPFVCVVELYDHQKRLRFHVFEFDGTPLLSVPMILASDAVKPERLRAEIQAARVRLQRRGFSLSTWVHPRKLGKEWQESQDPLANLICALEKSRCSTGGKRPMREILDVNVAVNVIHTAFWPLACVVDINSNDSRLRFRVLGADKKAILSVVGISLRDAVDPIRLRAEIEEARA